MIPADTLRQITERFEYLEAAMADGDAGADIASLAREYAELRPVVAQIATYNRLTDDLAEAEAMLDDPDMAELAREELPALKSALPQAERDLQLALLPKDAADARPAMVEIRPGTGGDEASLFAGDLLRMYQRYAEARGWKFDILEEQSTELGGIKEVTARVSGDNVFARLKYDSGVHRVQRVPTTESGGRIHTSAATVAVLPEAEEVDIEIRTEDIRIDTMRSSGAGGQHVNTTDSAVQITYLPTGLQVKCQDGRSQTQNKALGLEILRAKLFEIAQREAKDSYSAQRKSLVGSGDRVSLFQDVIPKRIRLLILERDGLHAQMASNVGARWQLECPSSLEIAIRQDVEPVAS